MASERRRYSREALLSYREASANIRFEIARIPQRVNRRNHKKSTSGEHEGAKSKQAVSNSQEDLVAERVDPSSTAWHRVNRHQWNAGTSSSSSYQRQRYPSGPHGDGTEAKHLSSSSPVDATALRPAPDLRRSGHGDWSRGCVGWRQRSYSGSERSSVVAPNFTNHFRSGRTTSGTDGDDSSMVPSRGRGRARNRYHNNNVYFQQPRGSGSGVTFSKSHTGNRPMSCVGSVSNSGATLHLSGSGEPESEFWQDEDWENMDLDLTERTQSHNWSRDAAAGVPASSPVDQLGKVVTGIRLHSKSCSVDPPPGFTLPVVPPPPPSTDDKRGAVEQQQQIPPNSQPHSSTIDSAPSLGQPIAATRWYYIDLEGRTQGPFSNQRMAGWMASGFLPLAIDIRRDCDECFLSLVDHMHLAGRVPFWDGYTRPPITQAMVASLHTTNESRWPAVPDNRSPLAVTTGHMGTTTGSVIEAVTTTTGLCGAAAPSSQTMVCEVGGTIPGGQPSTIPFPPTALTVLQQQQTPLVQQPIPTCMDVPFNQTAVDPHADIVRLYSEAQKLVANATTVQVERQQLVDQLAAINSTAAAMLLASTPCLLPPSGPSAATQQPCVSMGEGLCGAAVPPHRNDSLVVCGHEETKTDTNEHPSVEQAQTSNQLASEAVSVEPTASIIDKTVGLPEDQMGEHDEEDDEEEVDEIRDKLDQFREAKAETEAVGPTVGNSSLPNDGETGRKSKKKKKSKKSKPSADQERQAAWEAEFERRRAVARERQIAQDAEMAALAAEEATALAEEQSRLASEQARALQEQRRREAQRAKQDVQLSHLQLPVSAKWGGVGEATGSSSAVATPTASSESPGTGTSLLAIQAAQALEEQKDQRQTASLAAVVSTSKPRAAAWSAVVQPEVKPSARAGNNPTVTSPTPQTASRNNSNPTGKAGRPAGTGGKTVSGATDPPAPRSERSKPVSSASGNHAKPPDSSTSTKVGHASSPIASIWDLPVGGGGTVGGGLGKGTKKHNKKKNVHCSREAACFAAREELAHWCEAQLSSLPLPSVDLPTLVDLLCELEAADQVVEFIESSLGRSKQISQFSKAFLEKRACMLKAMP